MKNSRGQCHRVWRPQILRDLLPRALPRCHHKYREKFPHTSGRRSGKAIIFKYARELHTFQQDLPSGEASETCWGFITAELTLVEGKYPTADSYSHYVLPKRGEKDQETL